MKNRLISIIILLAISYTSFAGTYEVRNTDGGVGADTVRGAFTNLNIAGDAANDVVFYPTAAGTINLLADAGTLSYNAHLINNTGSTVTLTRTGNMGGPVIALEIGADITDFKIDSGIDIYYDINNASAFEGILINNHNFSVNNGLNSNITVKSTDQDVYGVRRINAGAGNTFVINGGINGDISLTGTANVFALHSTNGDMTVNGGINGDLATFASGNNSRTISNNTAGDIIIDTIGGDITAVAGSSIARGIENLTGDIRINTINGNINTEAGTSMASSVVSQLGDIYIDTLSGNIRAKAGTFTAIGIDGWQNLYVSNISGNIDVTAGSYGAVGLKSIGMMSAFDTVSPLNISGSIKVSAADYAYAVLAYDAMNINITGNIEASADTGNAYAIFSGRLTGIPAIEIQAADDRVTIGGGAVIKGKIDLSSGNDTLTLKGDSLIYDDILNIENISKTGSGTADLRGHLNAGSNDVNITGGAIAANGVITASSVNVSSGGVLKGNGTINGTVNSTGLITPGNSIDNLRINGNLFTSGSIDIEVNADFHDSLIVSGATVVKGGTVNFIFPELTYIKEQVIPFIQTPVFSGGFSLYTSNNPILLISGDGGNAIVSRKRYNDRVSLSEMSISSLNALSMLSDIAKDTNGDITNLFAALDYMNDRDLAVFGRQIDAEAYDAFNENNLSLVKSFADNISGRLQFIRKTGNTGIYFDITNNKDEYESLDNRSGFDFDSFGFNLGYDQLFGDRLTAGISLSYIETDVDFVKDNILMGESESYVFGGYASYRINENAYVDLSLSCGKSDNELERKIELSALIDSSYLIPFYMKDSFKGEFTSNFFALRAEGGYSFNLNDSFTITPLFSLDGCFTENDSFSEDSPSLLALSVDTESYQDIDIGLGTIFSYKFTTVKGLAVFPELRIKWIQNMKGDERETEASLKGYSLNTFISETESSSDNHFLIDIGAALKFSETISGRINYKNIFNSDESAEQISFNVGCKF